MFVWLVVVVCLRVGGCPRSMDDLVVQRYGLEYDLDRFNIVATDFFNMGAMENKSLNVFNTS